jgi:23S rRNA maturation mini-RNase III
MPRDYQREAATETKARKKARVMRKTARRRVNAERKAQGKAPLPSNVTIEHKKKLSKGGSNAKSNLTKRSYSANSADNTGSGGRPKKRK